MLCVGRRLTHRRKTQEGYTCTTLGPQCFFFASVLTLLLSQMPHMVLWECLRGKDCFPEQRTCEICMHNSSHAFCRLCAGRNCARGFHMGSLVNLAVPL